jgi:hypothetical protein
MGSPSGLDAAAIGPPPTLFFYWAAPDLGERIARVLNDGISAPVWAHPDARRAARELERVVGELAFRGIECARTWTGWTSTTRA